MKLKFKLLVRLLKSKNPEVRKKWIERLKNYEPNKIEIDEAKYLIHKTTDTYPEAVADWDNPPAAILRFISRFNTAQFVPLLKEKFNHLNPLAKSIVLEILLKTNTEESKQTCIDLMKEHINDNDIIFPIDRFPALTTYRSDICHILQHFIVSNKNVSFCLLHLERLMTKDVQFTMEQKEQLIECILKEYEKLKKEYLTYDVAYNIHYVYKFWKELYFPIRTQMFTILSLMRFLSNEKTKKELYDALKFKDYVLKATAVTSLLFLNENIDEKTIYDCAEHLESRLFFFQLLKKNSLDNFFPMEFNSKEKFVESEFAVYLLSEQAIEDFSNEMEIQSLEGYADGHIYLCKLKKENKVDYYLSPTYSLDFNMLPNSKFKHVKKEDLDAIHDILKKFNPFKLFNDFVEQSFYSFRPGVPISISIFAACSFLLSRFHFFYVEWIFYFSFILSVLHFLRVLTFIEKTKITIENRKIVYRSHQNSFETPIIKIKTIQFEKRRTRKFERKYFIRPHILYAVFYDKNHNELLSIPEAFLKREAIHSLLSLQFTLQQLNKKQK